MAVTEVRQAGITVSGAATSEDGRIIRRKYAGSYRVLCDDMNDDAEVVLDHFRRTSNLPYPGRIYSFGNGRDASAVCKNVSTDRVQGSAVMFIVKADFEPQQGEQENQEDENGRQTDNPLDWHDDISVSSTQISLPVWKAAIQGGFKGVAAAIRPNGEVGPIVNSAFVPFDPPLEEEDHIGVYRFTKRVLSWDDAEAVKFRNAINSQGFVVSKRAYGFRIVVPKFRGLIKSYSGDFAIANGVSHWVRTVELWVHPKSWRREILDMGLGFRALAGDPDGEGGTYSMATWKNGQPQVRRAVDASGYPLTEPVMLNGDGQPLNLNDRDEPVFLTYSTKNEIPFNGIRW
jgi:hypothetical protein